MKLVLAFKILLTAVVQKQFLLKLFWGDLAKLITTTALA